MKLKLGLLVIFLSLSAFGGIEPGLPTDYAGYRWITSYGAVANNQGAAGPNTKAIVLAIEAARNTPAKTVYVPPGTFWYQRNYSDAQRSYRIELWGVKLVGDGGERSVLMAASADDCAISITGPNAGIFNLTINNQFRRNGLVPRSGLPWDACIWVWNATDFYVANCTLIGGENSIICTANGGPNPAPLRGRVTANRCFSSDGDAIHLTGGSRQIYVAGNFVNYAGDDSIAVVSYDGEPSSGNILIENNWVTDGSWARGITVVGGDRVTIRGNVIQRMPCAGIMVANEEPSYFTLACDNIVIDSNIIEACPSGARQEMLGNHGSISIYNSSAVDMVSNMRVVNNWVYSPPAKPPYYGVMRFSPTRTSNIHISGNSDLSTGQSFPAGNGNGSGVTGASVTSSQGASSAVTVPKHLWPTRTTCNFWPQQWVELEPQCAPGRRLDCQFSGGDGTPLWLYADNNGAAQGFRFEPVGSGYYEIFPSHAQSTQVEVKWGAGTNGTPLQIKADSNHYNTYNPAQRWRIEEQNRNSGLYEFMPDCAPTRRMDVPGANPNATYIQIYTDNDGTAQRWRMFPR